MRDATRWPGHRIERAALMRILPVPQLVQARTAVGELRRHLLLGHATAQEIGDRGVIGGDVCKRLGGETAARRARQGTVPAKLHEHAVILTWRDENGHRVAVLRGGANHRRSADVDVLDDLGVVCAARQGRGERIEGDRDDVDGHEPVLRQLAHVRVAVAPRQYPCVHRGVQRLDPAVEHLRESGELRHGARLDAGGLQRRTRAVGGDQFDTAVM